MITYFTGYIRKKHHSSAIVVLVAFAICALVAAFVFWVMRAKMAGDLKHSIIHLYLFAVCFLLSLATIYIAFSKRIRIDIAQDENDGILHIDIFDKDLSMPFHVTSPIQVTKHWTMVDLGRRNKIKMLYVTIYNAQQDALITFTGGLGNFYEAPSGFEYAASPQQISTASLTYDTGKIEDIAHALWCYEDYLALKNKAKSI